MEKIKIGIDMGGSMVKVIYLGEVSCQKLSTSLPDYVIYENELDNNLFANKAIFLKIPNIHFEDFINFVQEVWLPSKEKEDYVINITGGGAHKWENVIKNKLKLEYNKVDEMQSLINGIGYVFNNVNEEVFTSSWRTKEINYLKDFKLDEHFPYLLVNIGSGVSILKVDSHDNAYRISGTSLGGGTFLGLCKLLTNLGSFDEIVSLSKSGDNKNLDLLVGDIYGGDYDKLNLKSWVIASNFGKIGTHNSKFSDADIIRSLMYMISDNIAQITYLNAQKYPEIKHIFFSGNFMELGPCLWTKLSYSIEFWSQGKINAKFLKHSGYLGAIGALVIKN